MAFSLAQKLGRSRNLLAFSLHPGVIQTHLGDHLDWNVDIPALPESCCIPVAQTNGTEMSLINLLDHYMP